jgi:hypothetical protein
MIRAPKGDFTPGERRARLIFYCWRQGLICLVGTALALEAMLSLIHGHPIRLDQVVQFLAG